MVAYDIDTTAVLEAVRHTEAELSELVPVPANLQRSVHAVEAALGSSRVAKAFTAYGTGELLPVWRTVLSRAEDAVQNVTQAVAEYLRADEEMRVRAEAASAAVPEPSGQPADPVPPPAVVPIVPQARPAPLPGGGGGSGGGGQGSAEAAPFLPGNGGGDQGSAKPIPFLPGGGEGDPGAAEPDPEPTTLVPLPGPPPWHPGWLFRPALPGRPPFILARDLMLRLRFPCPGHWHPHPDFRPRWWGPAYPPGGWHPRWPEPGRPPGSWFPRWPEPCRPPGAWFPRWPEPGLPPQGRVPWWPARPLPGLIRLPRVFPPPGHVYEWPLETKRLPFAVAVDGSGSVSRGSSSGKWGLT